MSYMNFIMIGLLLREALDRHVTCILFLLKINVLVSLLTDDFLQSANRDQQESRVVAGKTHVYDAVVKFGTRVEIYSGIARFSVQ